MKIITVIISGLLLTFTFGVCILTYMKERREWNKGKCKKCGSKWQHVANLYTGERVYVCGCRWCKKYCRISYNSIDGGNKK